MLSLCRAITSADEAVITNRIGAVLRSAGLSHKTSQGNAAAATMLPKETYRATAKTMANKRSESSRHFGASATNAPAAVATPLPPLKRSHTGNMCPRSAQKAATAASRKIVRLSIICGEESYRLAGTSPTVKRRDPANHNANSNATQPFNASRIKVATASPFEPVRATLVAPMFPLPVLRTSCPRKMRTSR